MVLSSDGVVLWAGFPLTDELRALDPHTGAPLGLPVRGVAQGVSDVAAVGSDLWMADNRHDTVVHARRN